MGLYVVCSHTPKCMKFPGWFGKARCNQM
uniref:Uncharacterized protein n=1 Tax=Anguilla anguilla TaxID=7936 RepID=A0A0E9S4L9_ANGAN